MLLHFPTSDFHTMSELGLKNLLRYFHRTKGEDFKQNSKYGVLLSCDLSIPNESVARLLEILPPCLESKDIKESQLSPYMKRLKKKLKTDMVGDRLISDLSPKKHYPLTGFSLKCVMRLGVELTAIHWAISYRQDSILKNHMEKLAELRRGFTTQGLVSNAQACKKLANR